MPNINNVVLDSAARQLRRVGDELGLILGDRIDGASLRNDTYKQVNRVKLTILDLIHELDVAASIEQLSQEETDSKGSD